MSKTVELQVHNISREGMFQGAEHYKLQVNRNSGEVTGEDVQFTITPKNTIRGNFWRTRSLGTAKLQERDESARASEVRGMLVQAGITVAAAKQFAGLGYQVTSDPNIGNVKVVNGTQSFTIHVNRAGKVSWKGSGYSGMGCSKDFDMFVSSLDKYTIQSENITGDPQTVVRTAING